MSTTDPGPARYRLLAIMNRIATDLQSQFDKALAIFTDQFNTEISSLDAVASSAQAALNASVEDRAALWTAVGTSAGTATNAQVRIDALTQRVAALEAATDQEPSSGGKAWPPSTSPA